jgi:alanine racemase
MSERRRAIAEVDVAAIAANVARLRRELKEGVSLCAVVKADGYGHGAEQAARAALAGGANWLAVAASKEAVALRQAGITEVPLLVMGALSEVERREALAAGAEVTVWHEHEVEAVAAAGGGRVHVKLDTGMGRLGTRDPAEAMRVVEAADRAPGVELAGVMTHFATADELGEQDFFERQLELFARWVTEVRSRWPDVVAHAANSAATLRSRGAHFDMVRCGVAIYGMDPFHEDPENLDLQPALKLLSYVAEAKDYKAGESVGYGRRFIATHDTRVGVLPIGYGDGWRRALSGAADVLIGGRRRSLVGTVSMDNVAVDLGPADAGEPESALVGAEAVLIGAQGSQRITAEEVARRLDTINYEVSCGLTSRVLRLYREGEREQGEARAQLGEAKARLGEAKARLGAVDRDG